MSGIVPASRGFHLLRYLRMLGCAAAVGALTAGCTGQDGADSQLAAPAVVPHELEELSIGGGLGVAYVEAERAPTVAEWGAVLQARWDALSGQHGLAARLVAEPGRAIAAAAAVTLYMVGAIKEVPAVRTYVAVDGGYGDNPRPMLYGSDYTAFMPARADE
ncbi:hypothetical protein [Candidatus Poriferisodalis sp.]|uniref:hypothetical protein n=1 Tax=Candidatus Poriferisodalis sp. TaxID=3101277 RepID=UPI003AF680EA